MFNTHKVNEKGFQQVESFKNAMAYAVVHVLPLLPEGREKAIFTTKLEEAMFFGTKAIASKEGNFTEIIDYPLMQKGETNESK